MSCLCSGDCGHAPVMSRPSGPFSRSSRRSVVSAPVSNFGLSAALTIKPRIYSRKRPRPSPSDNFFRVSSSWNRQHQHLAVERVQLQQCCRICSRSSTLRASCQTASDGRASNLRCSLAGSSSLPVSNNSFQARHGALPPVVDHQVARNREKPRLKPRLPVELAPRVSTRIHTS